MLTKLDKAIIDYTDGLSTTTDFIAVLSGISMENTFHFHGDNVVFRNWVVRVEARNEELLAELQSFCNTEVVREAFQ